MLEFGSIGSGSKGNGTLVRNGSTTLLVDCGFSVKEAERRLGLRGLSGRDLDAILVTHEHSDHIKGVGVLARRFNLPVYLTHGSDHNASIGQLPHKQIISPSSQFQIGDIQIKSIPVPHDAREACQFVFESAGFKLGLLTDIGHVTSFVVQQYQGCHGLLLECNHDPEMLRTGPYPPKLKRRVGGDYGHLSNQQAQDFLKRVMHDQLHHIAVTHISEKNNQPELAVKLLAEVARHLNEIPVMDQETGLEWHRLGTE